MRLFGVIQIQLVKTNPVASGAPVRKAFTAMERCAKVQPNKIFQLQTHSIVPSRSFQFFLEDINECVSMCNVCPEHKKCINTIGSYECVCQDGLMPNVQSEHDCLDIDECSEMQMLLCGQNASCANTFGSFRCECKTAGFYWSDETATCIDIDECLNGDFLCDENAICSNRLGSYDCLCASGWLMGEHFCEGPFRLNLTENLPVLIGFTYFSFLLSSIDVNECQLNSRLCGNNSFCHNTLGSYDCHCNDGFAMQANGFNCTDIDECQQDNMCNQFYFKCLNTVGSYSCICINGFELGSNGTCIGK